MNWASRLALLASPMLALVLMSATAVKSAGPQATLAPPESFAGISDTAARSAALFTEAGKVLTSPRCVNCHPAGDRPLQGEAGRLHQPPVERGVDGFGAAAMRCSTCHQATNFEPAGVPGNPHWHLAPREMAMAGQDGRRDLHADQGSGAQWRPLAATNPGASRRRPAGRLGVGAGLRTRAGSRHAKAIGRTYRSVAEHRSGVPEVK